MAEKGDGVGRAFILDLRKKPLAPLYVFYGEESYRRETAISFVKKRLVPDGGALWDLIELGEKTTADTVAEAVSTPPVLAEKKLVIVRGFDPVKNDISPVLDALNDACCTIFVMESADWKPDRRLKSYKAVAKAGVFAEFGLASGEELAGFVARCFSDRGHTISREDIEYFCFLCSPRMGELLLEIDKISAYASAERIRREEIDAVATRAVEARVFEMCDALTGGNYARALDMLSDLETAGEAAIAVMAVIARQFRQLYAARMAYDRRLPEREVMEILSLRFSSIVRRISASAARMPLARLRRVLMLCMETDQALKSSRAAPYETLRLFIMRCAVLEKEAV